MSERRRSGKEGMRKRKKRKMMGKKEETRRTGGREMVGSLAGDPGACPHLVARRSSSASWVMVRRRRRGVFIPDAVAPHKEGKSKSVPM